MPRVTRRIESVAEVLTFPFAIAAARWLAVLCLLAFPVHGIRAVTMLVALLAYATITTLFAGPWWRGSRPVVLRDEQHPLALPALVIIDVAYTALTIQFYGIPLLAMIPALDLAVLATNIGLLSLAIVDTILIAAVVHFHHDALLYATTRILATTLGPYLAVSYGLHGWQRARNQIRAIDEVLNASSDLGTQLSLSDVLSHVLNLLRQFRRVVPWDTAIVYVVKFDEEKSEEVLVAAEVAGVDAAAYTGKVVGFGTSVVGYAAGKQRPLLIPDLQKDAREDQAALSPQARASLVVPIVAEGQPVACIQLISSSTAAYTGEQLGLIARLTSIASVGVRNAMLHGWTREIADTDPVTGLLTSRAYRERLETEFRRAQLAKRSLSLVIVDLDNFKRINDNYGHPAGDELLRNVAALIRQHARRNDICCRFGGDEFVVIMPETIKSDAAVVASRIRKVIEEKRFTFEQHVLQTTASMGVASYPQDVASKSDLIKAADGALYTAKENGRNALHVFAPSSLS